MTDRMAVNAAIAALVERAGDYDANARTLIEFGKNLPTQSPVSLEFRMNRKGNSDSTVTGHTAECGNVTIKDTRPKEPVEYALGITRERIGHYKLWKPVEGFLTFHHFWKSDVSTQPMESLRPEQYSLFYSKDGTPQAFAVWATASLRLPLLIAYIEIGWKYMRVLEGKLPLWIRFSGGPSLMIGIGKFW